MAVAVTQTDYKLALGPSSPHTFSGCNIGAAAADRLVVVFLFPLVLGEVSITGVKIGGVDATAIPIVDAMFSDVIWWAPVPTGTSTNVEISYTGAIGSIDIILYSVTGADLEDPVVDSNSGGGTEEPFASCAVDVPANGAVIGFATALGFFEPIELSWSGVTEDFEEAADGGGLYITLGAASRQTSTALLGHDVEVESSDPFGAVSVVAIAFAPGAAAEDGFSNIYYGETQINAVKSGGDDVVAVYYGETKIFEKS